MKYEIRLLTREKVSNYINHHMKLAGAKMPIFTETAVESIALRSQWRPRVINTLTINSLLFGLQLKKEQIEEIVRLAIEDNG
ncbi:hypothetical protein ACIQZI_22385 [Peribacillus sp. NPDC096379]|uniref:hypothetical protein n=1 Tax=Peribacillus sp. NPDC096379 TaxID=3364393 RepID=UPI0037FFB653